MDADVNTDRTDPIAHTLRAIRRQQNLSLRDVEVKSDGRFKAVVVGAWERGNRKPTVTRAQELLEFYGYTLRVVPLPEAIL